LYPSTVSEILNQLANILKKIHHFYKVIQKQICDPHMFTHHVAVLPATLAALLIISTQAGAIILGASEICDCVTVYVCKTFQPSVCYVPRKN
jgi:uncharacterized membrane protein